MLKVHVAPQLHGVSIATLEGVLEVYFYKTQQEILEKNGEKSTSNRYSSSLKNILSDHITSLIS